MIETRVGRLTPDDVGNRVVVIHDGGTVEGTLESIWSSWDAYAKPEPGPRTRIEVTADNVKVEIKKLPNDYKLQIDRPFLKVGMDFGVGGVQV